MDTLEAIRRQAYADGLSGVTPSIQMWRSSDEFSRVYLEEWMAGSLAAMDAEVRIGVADSPSRSIVARFN